MTEVLADAGEIEGGCQTHQVDWRVAPLAALYPVTTVILALIIDRERLHGVQVAGLAFAVAALVLVSA